MTGDGETSAEAPTVPSRAAALDEVVAIARALAALGVEPPEAFVWLREPRSRWWAFGEFGRWTEEIPVRFGWPVGEYPWEGWVMHRPEVYGNEVFIRPTFVDAQGRIAPLEAPRATVPDNPLLTAEMCAEIADLMRAVLRQARRPEPDGVN